MVERLGLSRASRMAARHQAPGDVWIASEVRAQSAHLLNLVLMMLRHRRACDRAGYTVTGGSRSSGLPRRGGNPGFGRTRPTPEPG
jgi:hypothetical protein